MCDICINRWRDKHTEHLANSWELHTAWAAAFANTSGANHDCMTIWALLGMLRMCRHFSAKGVLMCSYASCMHKTRAPSCSEEAYSLALVHKGLGHVRIQLHIAGRVLDDVSLQLPLHMGAVEGLLHQLVQAGVAVAEVLARQSPLIKPVYHLHTSQKTVHSFMHVDDN